MKIKLVENIVIVSDAEVNIHNTLYLITKTSAIMLIYVCIVCARRYTCHAVVIAVACTVGYINRLAYLIL